jgi:hypothetical protein
MLPPVSWCVLQPALPSASPASIKDKYYNGPQAHITNTNTNKLNADTKIGNKLLKLNY